MKIDPIKHGLRYPWLDICLVVFIILMGSIYVLVASRRFFDFDEFQVMYESVSIIKDKPFYSDRIGIHFPFANIIISIVISLFGFKVITVLLTRYFILFINGISLYYTYKIGELLWDKRTGLFIVSLTLAVVIFLIKGIEIRHDAFNTLFNVIGCYYVLKYITTRRLLPIILSGFSFGLAVASTQKALIWAVGILLGFFLYLFREKAYKDMIKAALCYVITIFLPLILSSLYLMFRTNDTLSHFIQYSFIDVFSKIVPFSEKVSSFPYSRYAFIGALAYQNPLFYAIGIGGVLFALFFYKRLKSIEIVPALWCLTGIVFYLTTNRPFHQSFLPTIPALAIIVGGVIVKFSKPLEKIKTPKKIGIGIPIVFFLFIWPFYHIFPLPGRDYIMNDQIKNISYCLRNLKEDEKVLCFSQNQIFYDPMELGRGECGNKIFDYDAACFEDKMINEQCKIIINDYMTGLLNQEIQKKIMKNYVPINVGNILIPGFRIKSKNTIEKTIWIAGYYYSPTLSLEIDNKKIHKNIVRLGRKTYRFYNGSDSPIALIYVFRPKYITSQTEQQKST